MRRRWLVLVIALTGCASSVAGEGQRSAYSAAEVAGWTADGDLPAVLAVDDLPTTHVSDPVAYDQSPPLGGPHDAMWADCTGIAYDEAIRPENAVHSLEHGAVWITYDPALAAEDVAVLTALVDGVDHTMLR